MLTGEKTGLEQMLEAREKRAAAQLALLAEYDAPLLSFTMNIPGPVKRTPMVDFAFKTALREILHSGIHVNAAQIRFENTGCEALISASIDPYRLKELGMKLESKAGIGRLYDMDVLTSQGKLSRGEPRKCLICQKEAFVCSRSRAHSLEQLTEETQRILLDHACNYLASLAEKALISEVMATPKPGLVDADNSGAHTDMDIDSFRASAEALTGYFAEAVRTGYSFPAIDCKDLMPPLKALGLEAEKAMLKATAGANTHRGAIYSMGILLCAVGRSLLEEGDIFRISSEIAGADAQQALRQAQLNPVSNGERVYCRTGHKGARGEAAAGFPNARLCSRWLKEYIDEGVSENDAAAFCLIKLISKVGDSNILHRGGEAGLCFAQKRAGEIISLPRKERIGAIALLDREFIDKKLSPGGCADILALGIFLNELEKLS